MKATLAQVADAGIRTLMVTGDHPAAAAAIAREVGIAADRVLTGESWIASTTRCWPKRCARCQCSPVLRRSTNTGCCGAAEKRRGGRGDRGRRQRRTGTRSR